MEYLIVFQVLCGAFCAYVARHRDRSAVLWALLGTLVPVLGVALCLLADRGVQRRRATGRTPGHSPVSRPKRCCGHFLPDCRGCPYFRRPLFISGVDRVRGYCEFFRKSLLEPDEGGNRQSPDPPGKELD